MKLADLIDNYAAARDLRLKAQHAVDDMAEKEGTLKSRVMDALRAEKLDGAKGKKATVAFRRSIVAQLVDEAKFLKWANTAGNLDCLKIGVVGEAYRARLTAGVKVPGVESFTKEDLSVTPIKAT
jgi:hypothetical protein